LKRSNRLVLLIGLLLAIVAFASVVVLFNQRPTPVAPTPTSLPTVYARINIPLGTVVTSEMVETRPLDIAVRPADAFGDTGLVIGKTVRTDVVANALITPAAFTGSAGSGADVAVLLDAGLRAIAVQVDQRSGVGLLINIGDRVDMVIGITGNDKFPQVTLDAITKNLTAVAGINSTSTKVVLQNMQVIGTIVPPAPATGTATGTTGTTLPATEELVILAVTPEQAEVITFAQIDGQITLVLRSPKDFRDANGNFLAPQPDQTTGVVLRTLIDKFGVLPPQVIPATNLPSAAP
jgi:Flp pilus assembly protein CpaB